MLTKESVAADVHRLIAILGIDFAIDVDSLDFDRLCEVHAAYTLANAKRKLMARREIEDGERKAAASSNVLRR